ncbi:MAG TPA: hypothetical protein RWO09_02430 [Ruminococcus sp.]
MNLISLLSWTPYLFNITAVKFEYLSIINLVLLVALSIQLFNVKNEAADAVKPSAAVVSKKTAK